MEADPEYSERYRSLILGKTVKKVLKLRKDFKTLFLLRTEHELYFGKLWLWVSKIIKKARY